MLLFLFELDQRGLLKMYVMISFWSFLKAKSKEGRPSVQRSFRKNEFEDYACIGLAEGGICLF